MLAGSGRGPDRRLAGRIRRCIARLVVGAIQRPKPKVSGTGLRPARAPGSGGSTIAHGGERGEPNALARPAGVRAWVALNGALRWHSCGIEVALTPAASGVAPALNPRNGIAQPVLFPLF
ncbi:hypothetical protein CBM2587_A10047 [Cupriavidus taiwanensis]|uniref:Uncharacterized protein n=1 Tax=Cupriavidus taiwanensis TaxID=164546 RepID=A0A975WQS5_9BURK|nr:hypothetical protein CBM2587_A10047 [Cupriavidus taiwanensis]